MVTDLEARAALAAEHADPRLSDDCVEVLRQAAAGYTAAETGRHLHLSTSTVENRLADARRVLRARSTTQAVYLATRLGLLEGVPTP